MGTSPRFSRIPAYMELTARSSAPEEQKVIRLGEVPAAKSIAEWTKDGSSRALKFVFYLLALVVASCMWAFVILGTSVVVFFHLIAAALARGTNAALGVVLSTEAAAYHDIVANLDKLRGRDLGPRLAATEEAKHPASRVS